MTEDWFVPGGPHIGSGVLRLIPPPDWKRVILTLARLPPSMNSNQIRSHWRGFQREKKSWQEEIGVLLMEAGLARGGYERAIAGAFMRFPTGARRDSGNFAGLPTKALGDALVISNQTPVPERFIPDDDDVHYYFGGVEFEAQRGPARTRIYLYLQPMKERQ